MKTSNLVFGIFSLALLFVFLGKYAISINSVPLWVIIVGCLVLPVVDVVKTVREEQDAGPGASPDEER